jgi:hypothetical protein
MKENDFALTRSATYCPSDGRPNFAEKGQRAEVKRQISMLDSEALTKLNNVKYRPCSGFESLRCLMLNDLRREFLLAHLSDLIEHNFRWSKGDNVRGAEVTGAACDFFGLGSRARNF